jgi:hypothetical protein
MRWIGRSLAVLFLLWLVAILLGGLGVGPAGRLPLGSVLGNSAGPPPLHLPPPQKPTAADLRPALPAAAVPLFTRNAPTTKATAKTHPKQAHSASAPGQTTTTTTTVRGRSSSAPGRTRTHSATGQGSLHRSTKATAKAHSTTVTTTTTTVTTSGHGRALGH